MPFNDGNTGIPKREYPTLRRGKGGVLLSTFLPFFSANQKVIKDVARN